MERFTNFNGKTVLVTGAGRGIGAGIAEAFGEAGAKVMLHYNASADGAKAHAEKVGGTAVQADLASPAGAGQLLDAVGPIDILINNAGIYPLKPLIEMTDDDWNETIDVNLSSVFRLARRAAQRWVDRSAGGSILNISSIEAHAPGMMHAHYSSAKAALEMFTKAAAQELGPKGIRVNAVAPGLIAYPELESLWPEGVERWRNTCPLGRLGQREDVANACVFLASPAASFITGAVLVVDGGVLATTAF
jgi:NAD(P)-dependent dehydrogenase (short-subunit alcohol dehydrogenase family)